MQSVRDHIGAMHTVNDKLCPFCGKPNGCQAGDPNCWCNFEPVPKELRELVPADKVMKACICRACVLEYKADPEAYVGRHSRGGADKGG